MSIERPNDKEFLSPQDVATVLDVSPMTVYRLIHNREILAIKVGKLFRIHRTELQAYVDRNYSF